MIQIIKIIFFIFLFTSFINAQETKKNILIITSYSSSYPWDIDYTKGILEVQKEYKNLNIYKENLDSLLNRTSNYEYFYEYIKNKYSSIKIDGVITESNPAFYFMQKYGLKLFSNIPYVYYTNEKKSSNFSNIINITNTTNVYNSLMLAIDQNPNANNMILIDQEEHINLQKQIENIKKDLNIRDLSNLPLNEIIDITSKIDSHTFIFYLSYFKEPLGNIFKSQDVLNKISEKSKVPIYSIYSTYLNNGIVGGNILYSKLLSKESIKAINDLLNNRKNSYKVSKTILDNKKLKEFNLSIPKIQSAEIINLESKISLLLKYKKEIILIVLLFIILVLFLIFTIYLSISRKRLINKLKVKNEDIINERNAKDKTEKILIQQSKMAALGDMLQNIAHQWRQPLSVISTSASGIKMNRQFDIIDIDQELKSIDKILESTKYLSNTIEVFRNFFKPSNTREFFDIGKSIDEAIFLANIDSNPYYNIQIKKDYEKLDVNSFKNEFIQVILNIINNAKDALIQNISDNEDRLIIIKLYQKQNNLVISIKDNAHGVNEKIIDKIFQPYFTTKHKSKGTGIGLFMSNEIITKHMKGKLIVKNSNFTYNKNNYYGAEFIIYLPIKI
jgi:signal transduction histidine kinase